MPQLSERLAGLGVQDRGLSELAADGGRRLPKLLHVSSLARWTRGSQISNMVAGFP